MENNLKPAQIQRSPGFFTLILMSLASVFKELEQPLGKSSGCLLPQGNSSLPCS